MARPRRQVVTGWGGTAPVGTEVHPVGRSATGPAIVGASDRGSIARGLGRSYGDAAQNSGGRTLRVDAADIRLDAVTGRVRTSAGTSIDKLLHHLLPHGWFVPVTPGTRYVTVGGALAADIHGKNHHADGSFATHVIEATIVLADGSERRISPTVEPDLFWATAGGMGLTGVVTDLAFQAVPIVSSQLVVDTDRAPDLDTLLDLMDREDDRYRYSVAWLDILARGSSLGRGVLTRGDFSTNAADGLGYRPRALAAIPQGVPNGLLQRTSIRIFNEGWFRKAPRHRREESQTITRFFHPLDGVDHWNRLYGPQGFFQWQCVVPLDETEVLRSIVRDLAAARCPSFLSVLKRFGPGNVGPLSFPMRGWTLTLDVPTRAADDLVGLFDQLDERVAEAGGRIYLAKDARLRPELLPAMYPRLDEWHEVRAKVDPNRRFQSDLARRLNL